MYFLPSISLLILIIANPVAFLNVGKHRDIFVYIPNVFYSDIRLQAHLVFK